MSDEGTNNVMWIAGLVPDRVFPASVKTERELWLADRVGVDAVVRSVESGPDYLESAADQVASSPAVLELGIGAHHDGADALALLCMSDPAIDALRERVPCPVVGAAEASILLAASLAQSAVIVTILASAIAPIRQRIRCVPQQRLVAYSRLVVIGLAIAGALIALANVGSIFALVAFAVGAAGVAFGIPHLFAIFWRRLTWQGVLAGQLIGMAAYIGLEVVGVPLPVVYGIAVPLTAIIIAVVSVGTFTGLSPHMQEIFDRSRGYDELVVGEGEDLAGVGLPHSRHSGAIPTPPRAGA